MWRNSSRSCFGIDGFHAQQNSCSITNALDACVRLNLYVDLKIAAFQVQTVTIDRIHMMRASNERDGHTRPRQHSTEIATDGSCTNDGNPLTPHCSSGSLSSA